MGLDVAFDIPDPTGTGTLPISFEREINDGGCITFQGTGSQPLPNPNPRTIACNSLPIVDPDNRGIVLAGVVGLQENLAFTQYLLVHELGHIFENRSTRNNKKSLVEYVNDTFRGVDTIYDSGLPVEAPILPATPVPSVPRVVMGIVTSPNGAEWVRGTRGWGSGPDSIFTSFQQHPAGVFPGDNDPTKIDETAADMFLNWVYRILDTQIGFQNISWSSNADPDLNYQTCHTTTGCPDLRLPGDARLNWISLHMNRIFADHGWN